MFWNWGRTNETRRDVVADAAAMVSDRDAQRLLKRHGLRILNVTWEDTGRSKGSCWGPNISDMTIQVRGADRRGRGRATCLPVIRTPNFADKTGDVPLEAFSLLVGNERGAGLRRVGLREVLGDLRSYLHDPRSWAGEETSLLAPARDSHVLVSPQACFLPLGRQGKAEFNPVLFNYQSSRGAPAVLTILATREGTSVTVIDNHRDTVRDGGAWGQRLFFNQNGQRASFTGERQSEAMAQAAADGDAAAAEELGREGQNMVLLIQVPLKVARPRYPMSQALVCAAPAGGAVRSCVRRRSGRSDVEAAVVGHGEVEGPFTELDGLRIERDPAFPIRATVQFYQATSNGVLSPADAAGFAQQIARVYEDADYVGSLVTDGVTCRPTEPQRRGVPHPW